MKYSFQTRAGLTVGALLWLALALVAPSPAVSNAPSLLGGEIPLIDGAKVIKEKQSHGSGRFEFEVDISPAEVADFYNKAMESKGWPAGTILSTANGSGLMLVQNSDRFALKAVVKKGRTLVTIMLIRKSTIEAALKPHPLTDPDKAAKQPATRDSRPLPQNNGVIIQGTPPEKGAFVKRTVVTPPQGGSPFDKKDSGSLPENPDTPPENPNPDPEDSSSSDSSERHSSGFAPAANKPPQRLSVSVRVMSRWSVTEAEYFKYVGLITLQYNGTLISSAMGSPTVSKAGLAVSPILTYTPEVMTLSYNYYELKTSLRPIPDGFCQDPLIFEFQDGGVSPIGDSAGLRIQRSSAAAAPYLQNLSADKQQFLAAMQGSMAVPDYYEFYAGGPGRNKRIFGRKKTGKEECEYSDAEKPLCGCQIGIQMKLPTSGMMQGTRTWAADDQGLCPPSLGIHVSDVGKNLNKTPLRPPAGGNRNVTYTVSWMIKPAQADGTEFEPDEEKQKKRCDPLQQKILQLKVIRKLYENPNIRKYADENYPDRNSPYDRLSERMGHYQDAIENLFLDIMQDTQPSDWNNFDATARMIDTITDDQISDAYRSIDRGSGGGTSTCMAAGCGWLTSDPCQIRDLGISMNIHGVRNVKIVDFTGESGTRSFDAVTVERTGYFEAARASYMADHFDCQEVGKALFEAALAHEMTHCRQYVENCFPKSIDDMARYEMEAYDVEMNKLKQYLDKWGC